MWQCKSENIVRTISGGQYFELFFPNYKLLFIWMKSSLIFTIYLKSACEAAEVSFLGLFFWAPEEIPLCEILELEYDNKAGGQLPAVIWFPLAHGPHL